MLGLLGGLKGYVIWGLVAAILAGLAVHAIDDNHYGAIIATQDAKYADDMKAVSDTATAAAEKNLKDLQDQLAKTTADSAKAYQELQNVNATNASLKSAVAAGTRSLSIRASCPGGGGGVPQAGSPAGLDNGAQRAQLDPADSTTLLTIVSDGDQAIVRLKACQDYVRDISGWK